MAAFLLIFGMAVKDWAADGPGVDRIDSILTICLQSSDYSAWYLRVLANYRFWVGSL